MARTRNQRRKFANTQRSKNERELAKDNNWIVQRTQRGASDIPSKHSVKLGRKECRHMNEGARFGPGFKGPIAATGKEMNHKTGYIGTFRIKDGTAYVSQKAWMRKRP